jgi:hypothetical protein
MHQQWTRYSKLPLRSKQHPEEARFCCLFGVTFQSLTHLALAGVCMIEYLIVSRAAIIFWTSLALLPANVLFDAIENELERRGVEL